MPTHYQESKYPRRTRCPHMSSVTYLKKQAAVSRGHFAFNCCKAWVKNKELGRKGLDLLKRVDREGRVVLSLVQAGSDRVSALWQLPPRTQAFTNTVEVRVLQEKRAGLLPSPARQSASWDPAHKARQEHTGLASPPLTARWSTGLNTTPKHQQRTLVFLMAHTSTEATKVSPVFQFMKAHKWCTVDNHQCLTEHFWPQNGHLLILPYS